MIQKKLIEKFGNHINHMSCIYLNDGEKHLRSFLEELGKMNTIIEIGTYQGVSAAILSEFADRVYTYDIEDLPLRTKIWDYLVKKNIFYYRVKNRQEEIEKIEEIFDRGGVDLCFIDGEHFHGELEKDYKMCKECNQILIHDYDPGFKEVYDFVNNLNEYDKQVKGSFVLLTKKENIENPGIKGSIAGEKLRNSLTEEKPRKKRGRKKKQ